MWANGAGRRYALEAMSRWSVLGCSLLVLALMRWGSCDALEHRAPQQPRHVEVGMPPPVFGFPARLRAAASPSRILRGDYEVPETLVLAYDRDWEDAIVAIVTAASGQAQVGLLVKPGDMPSARRLSVAPMPHVKLWRTALDSPWVRDYGPLQSHDALGDVWIDFDYTWTRPADDRMPRWLSKVMHARVEPSSASLDGGAIISNGEGLCALTSASLREAGADPHDKRELTALMEQLGCSVAAVVPPIVGERTGHVDMIAQFMSPYQVVVAALDDPTYAEAARSLDVAAENIASAAASMGRFLAVTRVPIGADPGRFYSYVNVTRLDRRLLVPQFKGAPPEIEARAYRALGASVPGLALMPIPADRLINHGGAVHCATLGIGGPPGHVRRFDQRRQRPKRRRG